MDQYEKGAAFWIQCRCINTNRGEFHLSGLIGTATHSDMQKIRITGFCYLKIGYIGILQFGCYYLQYVPASKPFDHPSFEALQVTTLYRTSSDNR